MASTDQRRWGPDCQRRASCVGSPPSPRILTANPSLTRRLRAGGGYGSMALPDQVRQSSPPSSSSSSVRGSGCSCVGGVGSEEVGASTGGVGSGEGGGCQPAVCGAAGV